MLAVAACSALTATMLATAPADAAPAAKKSVKDLLGSLKVAAEPTYRGYDSFGEFGKSKKAGCRTVYDEVLATDADGAFPAKCKVTKSTWKDPYTGKTVTSYRDMAVDMFVPEQEAYHSGAKDWDTTTRTAYHNDVAFNGSMVAVAKKSLQKRSAREPSAWLPGTKVRCTYASNWVAVKYRWGLSVDTAEKAALTKALTACGWPKIAVPPKAKVTVWAPPAPTPAPSPTPSTDPRKDTCAELKAAGLGPYVRGQDPEYAWYRDDDGDGAACEATEDISVTASNDWQTERYVRTTTPRITGVLHQPPPDPFNSFQYPHVRMLAAGVEIWRGVGSSVIVDGASGFVEVEPDVLVHDGRYTAELWWSKTEDIAQVRPDSVLATTFIVDTEAPSAPTVTGGYGHATAVSNAPDLAALQFTVFGTTRMKAKPDQEVSYTSEVSGPTPPVSVRAEDRAGNLGPSASTSA